MYFNPDAKAMKTKIKIDFSQCLVARRDAVGVQVHIGKTLPAAWNGMPQRMAGGTRSTFSCARLPETESGPRSTRHMAVRS